MQYNDHVYCNNCGTEQIVEYGSDTCLKCGNSGTLSWAKNLGLGDNQEVDKKPQILHVFED